MIEQQEHSEIGLLAGNHFTGVNEDDHHVSDTPNTSTHFYQMPFASHHPSLLDHSDQQGLCTSLPRNYGDEHMDLLSPNTNTPINNFFLSCEPKHQEEQKENNHSGTYMKNENITAPVDPQEDSQICEFAGNLFYLLNGAG